MQEINLFTDSELLLISKQITNEIKQRGYTIPDSLKNKSKEVLDALVSGDVRRTTITTRKKLYASNLITGTSVYSNWCEKVSKGSLAEDLELLRGFYNSELIINIPNKTKYKIQFKFLPTFCERIGLKMFK